MGLCYKSKIKLFGKVESTVVFPTFGKPKSIKYLGSCVSAGSFAVGNWIVMIIN